MESYLMEIQILCLTYAVWILYKNINNKNGR